MTANTATNTAVERRKITEEDAATIRTRHEHGDSYKLLSQNFGISPLSVKKICQFRTHCMPGDQEMRPRYVQTAVPAEMYAQIDAYADKQQVDIPTAVLRMLTYCVKMNRAFSSGKVSESEPSNA